jgi:tRNA threonylcarbamoyl adenosine modification protein YeaZ
VVEQTTKLAVAIDTASEIAGVGLSEDGVLLAETTWRTRQAHSRELLPGLEWLLTRAGRSKEQIEAVFVCLGPGSYAGLRVGLSTAKALAFALEIPIVGVGRLAADAFFPALAAESRVIAVQAAGRAELAWAAYAGNRAIGQSGKENDALVELVAPHLEPASGLIAAVEPGDVVCGELEKVDEATLAALESREARLVTAMSPRVLAVAELGWQRLRRGEVDNADTLVPLYLRAPAIGPQR